MNMAGVVFQVTDTGIGMSPEQLGQALPGVSAGCCLDGSALWWHGPWPSRLARLLGGEITVVSALGQGSTFTVTLPAALSEPEAYAGHAPHEYLIDHLPISVLMTDGLVRQAVEVIR